MSPGDSEEEFSDSQPQRPSSAPNSPTPLHKPRRPTGVSDLSDASSETSTTSNPVTISRLKRQRSMWDSLATAASPISKSVKLIGKVIQTKHPREGTPPEIMKKSKLMLRVYYINHEWKSVFVKTLVVIYMTVIWGIKFFQSSPWYEFFYYLTLQGWTVELIYFAFSLYLDLLSRFYGGPEYISRLSKAAAQAMSELVFALQVVIVLFFWIVVYPQERWRSILWESHCHGIGLLLILGDYLYRFTGFSLRNHRLVLLFAISYSVFHISVVLYNGKEIYPGIHFQDSRSFLTFLAGLSTLVFTHKIVYVMSNWRWIKEDVKSVLGISSLLLFRQNSIDIFHRNVGDFGSELLSLPPTSTVTPAASKARMGRDETPRFLLAEANLRMKAAVAAK